MPVKPNRKICLLLFLICCLILIGCSISPYLPTASSAIETASQTPSFTAIPDAAMDSSLELYAKAAVLMDADSGRILYQKNASAIMPMASTTKIMTCILALEMGNPDDYANVSSYAASMPKVHLGARTGEYFRLEDLLYSLMLESHNDSAVIIAEHIAGTTEDFASLMNQKAKDIGCTDTFFITPNGLDAVTVSTDGQSHIHSTTAADLARIMSYCITASPKKEEFLAITRSASYQFCGYQASENGYITNGRSFTCNNHNAFLNMMEGALSGKTGFTANAGYCYVGALRNQDRTFVVALLACGWPNNKTYKWSDTKKLMNYGLETFESHSLTEVLFPKEQVPVLSVFHAQTKGWMETAHLTAQINRNESFTNKKILLKKGEHFQIQYHFTSSLTAPVNSGQRIGEIRYYLDDVLYYAEPVCLAESLPAIDLPYCIHQCIRYFLISPD